MEITIIDSTLEEDGLQLQGKLLWCVAPFANSINLITNIGSYLLYGLDHSEMDEETRVKFIKIAIANWKSFMTPEKFESGYQEYLRIKRRKHKTRAELIFINQKKHLLEVFHEEMLRYLIHIEKSFKIEELHSLFSLPRKGVIGLYHIDASDEMNFSPHDVDQIVTTILHVYEIPLFSDKVEKYIKGNFTLPEVIEPEDAIEENPDEECEPPVEVNVFRTKFLEFISPASLTYNKLEIIRNELVQKFAPVNHDLEAFNAVIGDTREAFTDITSAGILYERKMLPLVKEFQNTLDENIYFQQIANSDDDAERYTLYYCACNVDDLLMLFEKVSGIPKVTIDRVREELSGKIDFDSTTFFLYLKTKNNE
jgi:hypothetical protein